MPCSKSWATKDLKVQWSYCETLFAAHEKPWQLMRLKMLYSLLLAWATLALHSENILWLVRNK